MSKEKDLVLIDGDLIAFKCAAANEKRTILVKAPDGTEEEWKNRTTWKANMAEKFGETFNPDDYEIVDMQDPQHISYGISRVKGMIQGICDKAGTDNVHILLSGPGNFRDEIPLIAAYPIVVRGKDSVRGGQYKGKRDGAIKPLQLKQLRQYLVEAYPTTIAEGEADDLMAEMMYNNIQAIKAGTTEARVIGATIDKDADGTVGYLLNYDAEKPEIRLVGGLGSLYRDSKGKVKGEGRKFFYFQLLFGDPVDCYRPVDMLVGEEFGQVKALQLLDKLTTDKECWQVVYDTYKGWYPEPVTYTAYDGKEYTKDAVDILQMYCDCAHMRRWKGDRIDCRAVLTKMGILKGDEDETV